MLSQTVKSLTRQFTKQQNLVKNTVKFSFGNNDLRNEVTQKYENLSTNNWHYRPQDTSASEWTHKSNAETYIKNTPVIEVDQPLVRCMGGTEINAGHPQVYIKLDTRTPGKVEICKYCGLKYTMKAHHH